jgi:hypothetical protein
MERPVGDRSFNPDAAFLDEFDPDSIKAIPCGLFAGSGHDPYEAPAVVPGRRQSRHLPWVSLRSKIGWLARTLPGSDRQKDPLDIEQEIHINFHTAQRAHERWASVAPVIERSGNYVLSVPAE